MDYDVVFLHPPAIFDFRDKPYFPGPIAYTVSESTDQFVIPPIGVLSIAEYLDRHGYRVIVDNIGERMVFEKSFDVKKYLSKVNARVYGIDLHWCVHVHGAINLARLCKELHPDSLIVMGGLTATKFHSEIIQKYNFVDVVIRGEAEEAFLKLMERIDKKCGDVEGVPNTTYRVDGQVKTEPLGPPIDSIDKYEFTNLELLQPKSLLFSTAKPPFRPYWSLPICRGCIYNCKTCGGSAYYYKKYFGRLKPAPRSPSKIVEDLEKLSDKGVKMVFLFQDPRICGKKYYEELFTTLKREGIPVEHLTLELFFPANEEYISKISKLDVYKTLTISPESGSELVRRAQGRNYTNEQLFRTIKTCQQHRIPLLVFFMVALAYEDNESIKDTWNMWEKICIMDQEARNEQEPLTVGYGFGQMILMDPGSLAFDMPDRHGYRLIFKTLEEHVNGLGMPSWHQWINYETAVLDRNSIAELILNSLEYSINLRERFGIYNRLDAFYERFYFVRLSKLVADEVDSIMQLDENEKAKKLQDLDLRVKQIMMGLKK